MSWRDWLLSLTSALVGLLISALATNGLLPNPALYLRGRLVAIALQGGVLLSIAFGLVKYTLMRERKRSAWKEERLQREFTEERRRFLSQLDQGSVFCIRLPVGSKTGNPDLSRR
jgi:hypothetical protein